ncbi:MAG TPA: FecR domain-containing protein [Steroidobacter sp.]|uniref:FecR family protein n=1 Tax=Steroidobacter sp. TaxID=1978227 RepID=UPI002EDB0FE6
MSLDSDRKQIVAQQAAYWYCRWFDERRMPRADRLKLVRWRKFSPENVTAFLRLAEIDGMLAQCKLRDCIGGSQESNIIEPDFGAGIGQYDYQPSESVSDVVIRKNKISDPGSWRKMLSSTWAKAAAVAMLAVATSFTYFAFNGMSGRVVETQAAQWQRVTLDDGSIAHLDARTRIRVEYTAERRVIHLDHGWAFFDVVKESRRPFVVNAAGIEVTAVGTRFGVEVDKGVRTIVQDGIVKVTARDGREGSAVFLHKGQQLYVQPAARSTLSVANIAEVDATRELSWVTGRLEMRNTTLGEIVRQFNRRHEIQADIKSAELASRPVDLALMYVDNVEDFIEVMESRGVTVTRDGSTLLLRASGNK